MEPAAYFVSAVRIDSRVKASGITRIEMKEYVHGSAWFQCPRYAVDSGSGVRQMMKYRPTIDEIEGVVRELKITGIHLLNVQSRQFFDPKLAAHF